MIPLIVICGPTASGKTAISVELAKEFNGEIVSADSMQIYKELRICTARPDETEMDGVPHHLMAFLSPDEPYSAAQYAADAKRVIADIHGRNRLPFVVGGTGLYIDSLVNNITFSDSAADETMRRELEAEDSETLYARLKSIDPQAAERIHPNNKVRVIRFLEINLLTGKTIAENETESRREPSPYNVLKIGLCCDRALLYERIERRVDEMIEAGLIDEVRGVYEKYSTRTAFNAIGYKELIPYFNNEISLDEAIYNIKHGTRKYAKRQLTWFRRDENIHWTDPTSETALEECRQLIGDFLERNKGELR